jgi:hypothetical protein
MDSGHCIPFRRGLVARLIGPARGCSTAAAPTATGAGMLHGGDEPQHAGQSSGVHSARPLHRQDVAVALHQERHRRLCISMGSDTGRDRAGRWTVVRHRGDPRAVRRCERRVREVSQQKKSPPAGRPMTLRSKALCPLTGGYRVRGRCCAPAAGRDDRRSSWCTRVLRDLP